jgi:ABC-type phosphonate transport system ATPase subunit
MRSSISPWLRTSGPPIWISLPVEAAIAGRLHEVSQRVVDRDRLRSVLQPRRSDHRRQSLHEVTQRPIGLALRTDHHAGAEIGQRGTVLGQRKGRLVAAAQVLGVRAIAEPAQVDDPLDLSFRAICANDVAAARSLATKSPLPPRPIEWIR